MLAPTRELVRELNLRAQASRGVVGGSVGLADGCSAHRGDVVISRRNDRRLGVSGTDWVKNGDRWIVTDVRADGALSVRHATSRLHATLPAAYVSRACRARLRLHRPHRPGHHHRRHPRHRHRHRGPPDALHDAHPRPGREPRPHRARPTSRRTRCPSPTVERAMTATEVLEGILARDGAAVSATSTQARAASPAAQLQDAVTRYADAVALATSQLRANPDLAEPGPLPWLAGIPSEVGVALGMGSVPRRPVPPSLVARRRGRRRSRAAGVDGNSTTTSSPRTRARTGGLASSHRRTRRRANAGRASAARRPGGGVPPQPHRPDQRPLRRGREGLGRPHRRVRRQARRADRASWRSTSTRSPARASTPSASSTSPPPASPCPSTTPPRRSPTGSRISPPRGNAVQPRRSTRSRDRRSETAARRWDCDRRRTDYLECITL